MLGWSRQLAQYYPLKSRILHFATVLSSYTMPARRTVASYVTDTAAWVGDRGIQTVEEQRSVIRLRASLVDAMGVLKRSKKGTKKELAQLQRVVDADLKLEECADQKIRDQGWAAYMSTTAVAGEKIAAVADAERPKASTAAPTRAKEWWHRTGICSRGKP